MSQRRRSFPPIETHVLDSDAVGAPFRITVMRPPAAEADTPLPAVFMTDANAAFDAFRGLSWMLQSAAGEVEPFLLVGIGYPGASPGAGAILRARDLTFGGYPRFFQPKDVLEAWDGVLAPAPGEPWLGGAERFLAFVEEELGPFVGRRHAVAHDRSTYFGHSLGGAFGLYALLNGCRLFDRYVLSSPAVFYDGVDADGAAWDRKDLLAGQIEAFGKGPGLGRPTEVRLSVGGREEFDPALRPWAFTSAACRTARALRDLQAPDLSVHFELLPEETHASAWPVAFLRGIRAIYGTSPPFGPGART